MLQPYTISSFPGYGGSSVGAFYDSARSINKDNIAAGERQAAANRAHAGAMQAANRTAPVDYSRLFNSMSRGPTRTASYGVNAGPIWSEREIQQKVNSAQGVNNSATSGGISRMENSMGGRGFGGNSPLQLALAGQAEGQGRAANVDADLGTRWNAASGNAQHQQQGSMFNASARNQAALADTQSRNAFNTAMNAMRFQAAMRGA